MSYYELECFADDYGSVLSDEPDLPPPLNLWNGGTRFTVQVPEPLQYTIEEEDAGEMLPLYNTGASLLMTEELVNALTKAGVDNFDAYRATILDEKNGIYYENYCAVNIIGLIRAADLTKSVGEDVGLVKDGLATMWFDKMVLDESKVHGLLMFRLAESLSTIFIHESVKKHLEAAGFHRLQFIPHSDV